MERLTGLDPSQTTKKEKPLLRKVASEKLVKRLDPRRADPSKGISAVELGGQDLLGTFPKLLSTSAPKQRPIQRRGPDWGRRRGI